MNQIFNVIESLREIRSGIELADSTFQDRSSYMARLWQVLSSVEDEQVVDEISQHHQYPSLSAFFSREWGVYISETEKQHSIAVAQGMPSRSILSIENYTEEVSEMSFVHSLSSKKEFVMVGCGPFPETLMNAYTRTDLFANIVGVDRCEDSLHLARQVFPQCVKMEICRHADFKLADGVAYNYSNASAVLLANGLKNKQDILTRISATMPDDAVVLVRNPILLAKLVYEDAFANGMMDGFQIVGSVRPSSLSRTYALQKVVV